MTFIQPKKHLNLLNVILGMLVITILGGTFWIVVAYNKTVDLSHDIVSLKAQLDTIGANNTALNNNIISTLGETQFQNLAAVDHLVTEKKPEYYQIESNGISLLNNR